jgi:hypothetical protein
MTESALQAEHEPTVAPEEAQAHPAASRRQRLQALEREYSHIVVRQGTQQASAIETIRDRARVLAGSIEERCPEGPAKERAHEACMNAMHWAVQAISHR